MPIKKAAQKALRQNLKRKIRNLRKKRELKRLFKKGQSLVGNPSQEKLSFLSQAYKALDKAAKIGLIKKNKARRKKSQTARLFQKSDAVQ